MPWTISSTTSDGSFRSFFVDIFLFLRSACCCAVCLREKSLFILFLMFCGVSERVSGKLFFQLFRSLSPQPTVFVNIDLNIDLYNYSSIILNKSVWLLNKKYVLKKTETSIITIMFRILFLIAYIRQTKSGSQKYIKNNYIHVCKGCTQ